MKTVKRITDNLYALLAVPPEPIRQALKRDSKLMEVATAGRARGYRRNTINRA